MEKEILNSNTFGQQLYEEREFSVKLLAWRTRIRSSQNTIAKIRDPHTGEILVDRPQIEQEQSSWNTFEESTRKIKVLQRMI